MPQFLLGSDAEFSQNAQRTAPIAPESKCYRMGLGFAPHSGMAMLRLSRDQRLMVAEKLLDGANLAVGAMVFG